MTGGGRAGRGRSLFVTLFLLDLWERFSFFGTAAILVLYLAGSARGGGVGLDAGAAAAVFGAYMALSFLCGLPGGWLADRVLGPRAAALSGGLLIAVGDLVLAVLPVRFVLSGLLCVACGTGLVKPATAAMVALTGRGRHRTEAAYSIFYISIQTSAIAAPLVVGGLAEGVGWRAGFAAAAAGMLTGLLCFGWGLRRVRDFGRGSQRRLTPGRARRLLGPAVGVVGVLIALPAIVPGHRGWPVILVPTAVLTLAAAPVYVGWIHRRGGLADPQRRALGALVWLLAAGGGFWLVFAQDASVLGVFARDSTHRTIGGTVVPASWFQALHPLFVLLVAPLGAWWFARRRPRTGTFALAVCCGGASFLVMAAAAGAAQRAPVSPFWLVTAYLLQACGELVVGPAGLALAVRLAPPGRAGQYLGLYGLFAALGVVAGNGLYRALAHLDLPVYFLLCGGAVTLIAAGLAVAAPALDRRVAAGDAPAGETLEKRSNALSRPAAAVPE